MPRYIAWISALAVTVLGTPLWAERLDFHFQENLPIGDAVFPVNLTLRLEASDLTRLETDLFVDLTSFKDRLPALVSGPLYDDCTYGISVDLREVTARERSAAVSGQVTLRLNSCREVDGETVLRRGLSGKVDFTADLFARVEANCLVTGLDDLELNGRGLVGGLADLVGVVARARSVILTRAEKITSENPICPELPEAVEVLDPVFNRGGFRRFPNGALGAEMGGSIEVSATSMMALIGALKAEGVLDDLSRANTCACE